MKKWTARPADGHSYRLAEGPIWDGPRDRLLWVEIEAGAVHTGRLTGGGIERTGTTVVDRTAGTVVPRADGGMLVAGTEVLWEIGPDGTVTEGPRVLPAGAGRRLNDGKCEPGGDFLVGSMRFDEAPGGEELFRVTPDGTVSTMDSGLSLSNGLGWSPDGSRFYSIDTIPKRIHVREPGGPPRLWLEPQTNPDGMCVDAAGDVWVAMYGAGEVHRYSPAGELTGVVRVDEAEVTCPAFAGPGLDVLVITTRPRLFVVPDVGVRGLPATAWPGFR